MVMRRGDDLVEGGGAFAVAIHIQHRREIGGIHRVIGRILGDILHDVPLLNSSDCSVNNYTPVLGGPQGR
jgi:hypothetical protein